MNQCEMSNIKPAGSLEAEFAQREATAAVPLKGPDDPPSRAMIEAHNLTHLPAAPWCEICGQATPEGKATGTRESSTTARYCADDGRHGYWTRWSTDGLG